MQCDKEDLPVAAQESFQIQDDIKAVALPNCWEIQKCGREPGGAKVAELGACIASKEALGHSCWAVAGTLCGGAVHGTVAQKEVDCMHCPIYLDYNRIDGEKRADVREAFPEEDKKHSELLIARYTALS